MTDKLTKHNVRSNIFWNKMRHRPSHIIPNKIVYYSIIVYSCRNCSPIALSYVV